MLYACHLREFGKWPQADRHADNIHIGLHLCSFYNLSVLKFGDHRFFHMICPFCLRNRTAKIKRDSGTSNLRRMDTIGADLWHPLHNTDDIRPCLKKLVRNNHADISRSDHQNSFPRKHPLYIRHCLRCSGSHHTWECPARKSEWIFRASGTQKKLLCLHNFCLSIS